MTGCGDDSKGQCLWWHFFAVIIFTVMVFVYLAELRKLLVKLTDPTYIHELEVWRCAAQTCEKGIHEAVKTITCFVACVDAGWLPWQ